MSASGLELFCTFVAVCTLLAACESRTYSATFTTTDASGCGSDDEIGVRFVSECDFRLGVCANGEVGTETFMFVPPSEGNTETYYFDGDDIGDITHIEITKASGSGTDEWCLSSFAVLLDEENDITSDCSLDFIGSLVFVGTRSGRALPSPTARRFVADISSNSDICDIYIDEIDSLPLNIEIGKQFDVQPCTNGICDDDDSNPNCVLPRKNRCTRCDVDNGYFLANGRYPCLSCDVINGCESCRDHTGCKKCNEGFDLLWSDALRIFTCVQC